VRGDDVPAAAEDPWIKKLRGDLLRFALPLAPLALPAFVYNLGDRYVLGWINGDAAVGEYAAAYGLATMPFIFFAGIGLNTLRPVLFDAVVRGDRATERKTLLTWLCSFGLLSVAGAGLLGILAPLVVRLALAPEFRRAAELLPWIAAA
jgi:O-antigen/teichoic acid export membrane protein